MTRRTRQLEGTAAQRPTASKQYAGVTWTSTDTGEQSRCDGTVWTETAPVTAVVLRGTDDTRLATVRPWLAPTRLASVPTLRSGFTTTAQWSPDGRLLAVGGNGAAAAALSVYERNGVSFTLAPAVTLNTSLATEVRWSPDGALLAVVSSVGGDTVALTVLSRSGSTLTPVGGVPALNSAYAYSVAWSPCGTYLAVGTEGTTSTSLTVYSRSGSTYAKLTTPTLNGSYAYGLAWSPCGRFLAVSCNVSGTGTLTVLEQTGTTFTALPGIPALLEGSARELAWSPDGRFLTVAGNASGSASTSITAYTRSGTTFTRLGAFVGYRVGASTLGLCWSPDGQTLARFKGGTAIDMYKRVGDTLVETDNPASAAYASGTNSGGFSPDGRFLAVASSSGSTATALTIYETTGTTPLAPAKFIQIQD